MTTKPIKRNENILILSRDHHFGLLFCWKIKQGIKRVVEPERIRKYVQYFWNTHLRKHFAEEEEYLFSKVTDRRCDKAIKQHKELQNLFETIPGTEDRVYELLSDLADSLTAHIRYEERELFPHLEKIIDEKQLKEIGALLQHSHKLELQDDFGDEFWI